MSAVDFEGTNRVGAASQSYDLLKDYLGPATTLDIEAVKDQIFETLPHHEPQSNESWRLANELVGIARCIPANDPVLNRLVDLTVSLHTDPRWQDEGSVHTYDHLGMALRDQYEIEQSDMDNEPSWSLTETRSLEADLHYRNFNAFLARLTPSLPHRGEVDLLCIWVFEAAHEGGSGRFSSTMRDGWILAAVEWIAGYGELLFGFVDAKSRSFISYPGPLWEERAKELTGEGVKEEDLPLCRWHFWIERFQGVADGSRGDGHFAELTKSAASAAALRMQEIERARETQGGSKLV